MSRLRFWRPSGYGHDFTRAQTMPVTATLARAGTNATRFTSAGVLEALAADTPRHDHDPLTFDRLGLLIETAARTNGIRNKTGAGATPPGDPTNWATAGASGMTIDYEGSYTERGMAVLQFRCYGTATGTTTQSILMETSTAIAAVQNDLRVQGAFLRHAQLKVDRTTPTGSSLTGVSAIKMSETEYTNVPAVIARRDGNPIGLSDDDLIWYQHGFTVVAATAAYVRPAVTFTTTNGAVIDFYIDIALPHNVAGSVVLSPISPTTSADTRAAESLVIVPPFTFATAGYFRAIVAPRSFDSLMSIQLDNGTDNNRIYFQYDAPGTTKNWGATVGGVGTAGTGVTGGVLIPGEPFSIAATWGAGSIMAKIAGNAAETITPASLPALDRFRFGQNAGGTGTGSLHLLGFELGHYRKSEAWLDAVTFI